MGTTENVQAWSTTAATNASADTAINWAEGQDAASVNNSARSMMAALAKHVDDIGGALTASGTFNALTVTTNQVLSATQIAAGLRLLVKALSTNTAPAVTLAPDGLTAAPIKRADGSALAVGSIQAGALLDLVYNTGTSEWWATNIPPSAQIGVTDGSNAAAGQIGEYMTATNPSGIMTNGAQQSIVGLTLTPGDWDVWGQALILAGATPCSAFLVGISQTINTLGNQSGLNFSGAIIFSSTCLITNIARISFSGTTQQAYLTIQCNFIPGGVTCQANIYARRVR